MTRSSKKHCIKTLAVFVSCASCFAQAQPDNDKRLSGAISEIVVTANKREQRLTDVGKSVSALSGDTLKNQQINSMADFANAVPGLSYSNTSTGTPVFTLRGIGFYEQSIGSYPSVSVYLDEAPLPFPVLARHMAFDVERVEVLKGPQGTLFGQNATGGAINYVAAKPSEDFAAGIDLTYGRFDQLNGEMFVTGALSDNLNARLAGRFETADGWQDSISRSETNGEKDNYMARLMLDFSPTENASFLLNINGSKDKSDTQAAQLIGVNFQNPIPDPSLAAAPFAPESARDADWSPGFTSGDNEQWQISLRGDIDLSDDLTLTFLTSYVDYEQQQGNDVDGVPFSSQDSFPDLGEITSFSQEVRIANDPSNSLRWVAGANYEKSEADQHVSLYYPNSSATATYATLGYPIQESFFYSYQEFENYAFFGNLEYDVTDQVTIKGGVRYTDSEDTVESCHGDSGGITGGFFYGVLFQGALGPYPLGSCFVVNNLPYAVGDVPPGMPGVYKDSLTEDNVSWTAGVDWKASENGLVYANVAKGYKAGSFPVVSPSVFESFLPVTQESVLSYEVGLKWTLLEETLQVNSAFFYYDYDDKQLRSKIDSPPFGRLDVLQNIPESSAQGFEVEILAQPVSGLTINAAYTYIDAEIDEFVGINAGGLEADFAGSDAPFTPDSQLSVSADYEFKVSKDLYGFIGASVNYRSDAISIIGGDVNPATATPQDKTLFGIDSYSLLDLRAGVETTDGKWRVSVWGKNVTDEYYWNNAAAVFDTITRYAGMPATYGATVSFRY
ncbi:MAG: TonB-dependent receptor [Porticoccaceae bacterium]